MHRQAAGRPDQAGPGRHDLDLVPAGELARMLEYLMRASKIEGLEPIENYECDAAVEHASTLQSALAWRQRPPSHDLRHTRQLRTADRRPAKPVRNHSPSPACSNDIARAAWSRTAAMLIPVAAAIAASGRSAK